VLEQRVRQRDDEVTAARAALATLEVDRRQADAQHAEVASRVREMRTRQSELENQARTMERNIKAAQQARKSGGDPYACPTSRSGRSEF
jgi:chromosome segregation ATPase